MAGFVLLFLGDVKMGKRRGWRSSLGVATRRRTVGAGGGFRIDFVWSEYQNLIYVFGF